MALSVCVFQRAHRHAAADAEAAPCQHVARRLLPLALGWLLCCPASLALSEPLPEYSVKAAFLYNFLKFVEWPPNNSENLNICLLGGDPFGEALASIQGKQAQGRSVQILRNISMAQAKDCHILFISTEAEERLNGVLRQLDDAPVLTVGESERFATAGGMVGLVNDNNRVKLEINRQAVEKAKLKMSSQLLKLARVI